MTPNGKFSAWKPDDAGGSNEPSAGRYVSGATREYYALNVPCTMNGVVQGEMRDQTSGSVLTEPGRLSCDEDFLEFELGDYVAVTVTGRFTDRVGEIRRINWSARGRRQTFLYLQWLQLAT